MSHPIRTSVWLLLHTLFVAVVVTAQQKPDFSGRWVLQQSPQSSADIPGMLVIHEPLRRTTARGDPMPPVFLDITVERHFENEIRTDTYQIGMEGGSVGGFGGAFGGFGRSGPSSRFSVRWDGERLRFDTKNYPSSDKSVYIEHNEAWWLDGGRLLITVVDSTSGSEATRTLIYRQQ